MIISIVFIHVLSKTRVIPFTETQSCPEMYKSYKEPPD